MVWSKEISWFKKRSVSFFFFVIPTVLKDTSGKDLNHEARKEVTKLAKGVRESP